MKCSSDLKRSCHNRSLGVLIPNTNTCVHSKLFRKNCTQTNTKDSVYLKVNDEDTMSTGFHRLKEVNNVQLTISNL